MSSTSRMVARRDFRDRIGIAPFLAKAPPGCKKRPVGESAAEALEVAIADAGLLLVELEKFRAGQGAAAASLRSAALALGQRARRLHRAGTLDQGAAAALLVEAEALLDALRGTLDAVRGSADFRAAVTAHGAGDHARLAVLLPALFEGLEHVARPPALFRSVTWLRRNRPLPAAEVVSNIVGLREGGIAAEGDARVPGLDPDLPAVPLTVDSPGEPVLLRFPAGALPPAVFRLRDTHEHLVHVARLVASFEVVVPEALDLEELGEISLDHARYRSQLVDALTAAQVETSGA